MNKQISPKIVSLIFSVLVICFAVAFYTFAVWQEPTQPQPGGNVPPPLNTSSQAQVKIGGLMLNTGGFPNGLIVDKGNVGIGTTEPSEKLDVVGNIVASDTICDSTGCIGGGGAGAFGAFTDKDSENNALTYSVVYKATSDGFVIFRNNISATANATIGYTDSNNPPATERAYASEHSMNASHSAMMPVKKDDYWRITTNSQPRYIYWLPVGTGQCVKQ